MQQALLTVLFLCACSAVVDPDPSLLGDPVTPMECSTDCSDGVECTIDRCEGTVCVNERDNSLCADTERCDMVMGCIDARCTTNAECDDGLACNGVETCGGGRCEEGAPVVCDDGIECTVERCDDATGTCSSDTNDTICDDGVPCTLDRCSDTGCVNEPDNTACDDGICFDGAVCTPEGCQGGTETDCDDGVECTVDSCDAAAMPMCVHIMVDGDGDGFSPIPGCGEQVDCNDEDPLIYPGAEETCDAIDQNCDGDTTDGCETMIPDTCETALLLAAPGAAPISVSGNFVSYTADYRSRCSDDSIDAVFMMDLEAGRDYIIDTVGSSADTVLALTDECGDWNFAGRGCNDDIVFSENTQSRLFLRGLSEVPGLNRVFILLSQYSDSDLQDWVLNVRSVEAPGLMCSNAMDISQGGGVIGYIAPSAPSLGFTGCIDNSLAKREHYFDVVTSGDSTVRVRSWSDDFDHGLSRRRSCFRGVTGCDSADSGDRAEVSWSPNRAQHLIVIDGSDGASGDFYTLQYEP